MSSYRSGHPPPYRYGGRHHSSRDMSGGRALSKPSFSHYPEEEFLHFYRWTSPPGVIKIVSIIIIIFTVAMFACVASTVGWDSDLEMSGFGGIGAGMGGGIYGGGFGGGYGGYGGGGYGGGGYGGGGYGGGGYGVGGNYVSPQSANGFILAIGAFTFLAVLVIFIIMVSRQKMARSRRFYLAVIIISAILAFLLVIATIVYLVAINPTAQTSGSIYYSQVLSLCSQYQTSQPSGIFINQYMYHYCVVEPQEAIAVVLGFLVTVGLVIIAIFAAKTRQKIWSYGRNILWHEVKVVSSGLSRDLGEWVNTVSGEPEQMLHAYPDEIQGRELLEGVTTDYSKPPYSSTEPTKSWPLCSPGPHSTESEVTISVGKPNTRSAGHRVDSLDDTDYTTGAESGEELDDSDFDSEFPTITNDQKRVEYKREFDKYHKEYKILQEELDDVNKGLVEVDHELHILQPGSSQYMDAMNEFNRLKNLKKSAGYQMKKRKCKYLKTKLSHIKRKVNDYDRRV